MIDWQAATAVTGLPEDNLRHLFCILLSFAIGQVYRFLPNIPSLKHFLNLAIGLFFIWFCFDIITPIHLFITGLVSYLILWQNKVLGGLRVASSLVFYFALTYLSVSHCWRMYHDWGGWRLDFTGMQMIFTLKVTAFAYNLYDGHEIASGSGKIKEPELQRRALTKLPSLLEFFGWVYFYPSVLVGPKIEFRDYLAFVDLSLFNDSYCKGSVPSTLWQMILPFLKALPFIPLSLIPNFFPTSYLSSIEALSAPLWQRMINIYLYTAPFRAKYYFAWYLAEAACISCGMGYGGLDATTGKPKWDRCCGMNWVGVEIPDNLRGAIKNWNMGTQDWMFHYVYYRVKHQGVLMATLITMTVSAFWHGFYPGYYIMFVSLGLADHVAKEMWRKLRPHFKKNKIVGIIYDLISRVLTLWILGYMGVSFILLDLPRSYEVYKSVYFSGHIVLVLGFVIAALLKPPPRSTPATTSATAKKQD